MGEAIQIGYDLINRSSFVPLGFDVLKIAWFRHDISYSHLKVFGCKAFTYISKEQRQKLDGRVVPCIFLGYRKEENY